MSDAPAAVGPATDGWAIYRRVIKYARPHAGMFFVGVLGAILFAASNASLAYLVKALHEGHVRAAGSERPVAGAGRRGGAVHAARHRRLHRQLFSELGRTSGHQRPASRCVLSTSCACRSPISDQQQSGHLLSKLTNNIELVAAAATNAAISLISDSLSIVILIGYLFYLNWHLAAFCIAAAPAIAWLMQIANRSFRRYSQRIQNSMGDITRVAKEAIDALRLIKIFNAEAHQTQRFELVNEHNRASNMKLVRAKSISNPVVQCIAAMALGSVLFVSIHQVQAGDLTLDEFFGFLTALFLIPSPLRSLVNMSGPLQQGIAAGQSVFEVLDEPTEGDGGTRTPGARPRRDRVSQCVLRLRGRERRRAAGCEFSGASRRNRGHRRPIRQRQDARWWVWCRASTMCSRARCCWTESMYANIA